MISVLTRRRLPWKIASQSMCRRRRFRSLFTYDALANFGICLQSSLARRPFLAVRVYPGLNPVFRQNVQFLQAVQALAQFCLAKANPFLPAGKMTHRLKDLSRQIAFPNESFKISEFTFKAAQVSAAVGNQIDQGPNQEITLRSEPFPFTFIWDPLVAKNLEDLANLLKHLPGEAPALFALSKTLIKVHMFTRTYSRFDCQSI
jgi:hypothetical protein